MLGLIAMSVPTWVLVGVSYDFVARALGFDQSPVRIAFAAVAAWIIGFLAVPVPAGVGLRELIFVAAVWTSRRPRRGRGRREPVSYSFWSTASEAPPACACRPCERGSPASTAVETPSRNPEWPVQKGDALLVAKRSYVAGARRMGQALALVGIGAGAPPTRDRRVVHWAYSLTRVHDSIELAHLDVPWWTYGAIDAVEAWLAGRSKPARVYEYGSGASTVWLARRAGKCTRWNIIGASPSIFAQSLKRPGQVTLQVVEPHRTQTPTVPSTKEGCEGLDFAEYVASIHSVGGEFRPDSY